MKWFRFYHEACRDPKVQDMRPELFKFWVNILCVASEQNDRGRIPSEAHVKRALGLGQALTKRWLSELEALALLHRSVDGVLIPHGWDERQPESDDSSKRQKRRRERTSKDEPSEMSRELSRDRDRDCHADVAPRVRSDSDTDIEEEKKIQTPTPLDQEPEQTPKPAPFVPPDWIPSEDWDAFMEARRKLRAAQTDYAKRLIVAELARLRDNGHDPAAVIRRSIRSGWKDVFPLPASEANRNPQPEPRPKPHVAPLDSPAAIFERQNRAKLFAPGRLQSAEV